MDTRAGELLARGRARLTDLEDEPSLLADVEHTLAGVYLSLGEYDEAEELYARSLAARRGAGLSEPTDLVASLQGLARVLSFTGSLDSAAVLLGEALEAGGDRTGDAGGPEIELQRAEVMMDLGTLQFRRADFPAAEALYREALELYEGGLDYPDRRIAQAQGNLGLALSAERRLGESERYNRAAVATFEALPGDQSAYLAQAYNNLAVTLERQGRLAEAEGLQRRALEAKRASLPVGHSSIGVTMTNLAVVLARQGELDEAEALLLEALELQRTAVGPEHRYVINALTGLAEVDMARGDPRGALTRLTEARSLVLKAVPADHPRVATLLLRMGAALRAAGDPAGAEPLLREATGIRERALGPDAPQSVTAKVALAGALIDLSRFDEAATLLEAANAGSAPSDDGDGIDASGGAATAADELERLRSARGG
jgi:tetratricopeptide (TPR) repeat protein